MLTNKGIAEIAKKIFDKNKIKAALQFVSYNDFVKVAKKSPLVLKMLSEGYSFWELSIPALYSHKTNTIFINKDILKRLLEGETKSLQIKFIKAILYHEMFHVVYKQKLQKISFKTAMSSEELAEKKFQKEYPKLAEIAKKIIMKKIHQ